MDRDTLSEKISFWAHIRFGIDDEPEWAHDLADDILESIVPTTAVPTPEQRAAVGRIVRLYALKGEQVQIGLVHSEELSRRVWEARAAIQPGDIEAARAVAEGGK